MKYFLIIISLLIITTVNSSAADNHEKALIKAVKKGDIEAISGFLNQGYDINAYYGSSKKTLLHLAIVANQLPVVKYLIENEANIELRSKDRTPLMWAASLNRLKIAHYLLDEGADVYATDNKNNTALFFAAKNGSLRLNRLLVRRGSDPAHKNQRGWMPHDNAISSMKDTIAEYLKTKVAQIDAFDTIPDYFDGPHVIWENHQEIMAIYFTRDSILNKTLMVDKILPAKGEKVTFNGFESDTNQYTIYRKLLPVKSDYQNVKKIFAVGDLHGQFDTLCYLLQTNVIIDNNLNWFWGEGHLVFTGDVFDRGDQVTECLWLIYKLERQAYNDGGGVHLILGNHELMNLTDDLRYQNKKYDFFSRYFDISYPQLYTTRTVMGEWLRSRNSITRINDILFVHGGISPNIYESKLTIDSINHCMRKFLYGNYDEKNAPLINLLLFTYGPFWYRGYFQNGRIPAETTSEEIQAILSFYDVSHMVIGHTDVKTINPMFDGRVFPIDIPFEHPGFRQQSLLVENDHFYRVYSDGTRVMLK